MAKQAPAIRELLLDLKAALLIGDPESLQTALEGVRRLPDDQIPPAALPDLGRALAGLPHERLRPLSTDRDPAIRAIGAAALAERFGQEADEPVESLHALAGDPNPIVRQTLAQALTAADPGPEAAYLLPLAQSWLEDSDENRVRTGLELLPACDPDAGQLVRLLGPLAERPDHTFRAALVDCLNRLAQAGQADAVLELLLGWAGEPQPNLWVITRTLSASWAVDHARAARRILKELANRAGSRRAILRALDRLGGKSV